MNSTGSSSTFPLLTAVSCICLSTIAAEGPAPGGPAPSRAKSAWESLGRIISKATNLTSGPLGTNTNSVVVSAAQLSPDQVSRALKEALGQGLDRAVAQLGKQGGFLTNLNVRIPMPERLQTVERFLRRAGQDKVADEFVVAMNHAAEQAVPAAAGVFAESLKQMTVQDAHSILKGPPDAATEYFRRTSGQQLEQKFRPIVENATAQAGVTAVYKRLVERGRFATFLNPSSLDLDGYVTSKATDGLFQIIAEEEKQIRQNPVARTTDLLQTVFGSLGVGTRGPVAR